MSNLHKDCTDAEKHAPKYYTDTDLIKPLNRLISVAELLTISSSPLILVPALAGYYVVITGNVYVSMIYDSVKWVSDRLDFGYDGGNNMLQITAGEFDNAFDTICSYPTVKCVGIVNANLMLRSAASDWVDGNSPIRVNFDYKYCLL